MGYRDGEFLWFKGALSGSNLELFLHELTRNVDNIENFDKLPIPFRAVATNMVTGKEVVFDSRPLYQAMRASMSVPGMFAPVELDGRILGDGGLVNNLPVDIVRAMGADIVIAVNIGTPLMSRDQLPSVVGYASQMINILTEQNVRAQLALLRPSDILISPDLGDLTFIDFAAGRSSSSWASRRRRRCDRSLRAGRTRRRSSRACEQPMHRPPRAAAREARVRPVEGTQYANPEVLERPDADAAGRAVRHRRRWRRDIARLYGRGDYEQIDYRLVKDGKQGVIVNVAREIVGSQLPALRPRRCRPTCRARRCST